MGYRIPRHIKPNDLSVEADAARLEHFQQMQHITGFAGFRKPSGNRGRKMPKTRLNKIADRMMEGDSQ